MSSAVITVAKQYGFYARKSSLGYFIAPVRYDGTRASDTTLITNSGDIVPYDQHDAQAHLCAKAIASML